MSGPLRVRRAEGVIARRIAGETLLVPIRRRAYEMSLFTLNEVGTRIWELIENERSLDELARILAGEYEAEPARVRADVEAFVAVLKRIGCLEEVRR